jgi:hypothetical protein
MDLFLHNRFKKQLCKAWVFEKVCPCGILCSGSQTFLNTHTANGLNNALMTHITA